MMNDNYISHDKGAISPIFCGAKLMAPGINGGDRDFKAGDIVCLRYDQEVPALGFVKLEQDFTDIMKAGRNGSIGDILLRVGDGFWIFGE